MGNFRNGNSFYDDNRYEDDSQAKAMMMGILFSVLGAIAWIAISYFLGWISYIASVSLAFLFCVGYTKYGGKIDRNIETFLIGYNLLLSLIISYLTIAIHLSINNKINIITSIFTTIPSLLSSNEVFRGDFLVNIITSLIFGFIGVIYVIYLLRRGSFRRR